MDSKLVVYYTIKRTFIFFDEWLMYYVLYKLYIKKYYRIMMMVFLYGISCLYTSYKNINKIESKLINVKQIIWITDQSPLMILNDCINYMKNINAMKSL